jgi:hypothetical protein
MGSFQTVPFPTEPKDAFLALDAALKKFASETLFVFYNLLLWKERILTTS